MSLIDRIKENLPSILIVGAVAGVAALTTKQYHIEIKETTPFVDSARVARTFVGNEMTLLGYDYNLDGRMDKIDKEEMVADTVGDKLRPFQTTYLVGEKDFGYYNKILADSGK